MTIPVREVTLVPIDEHQGDVMPLFERLARDPKASVEKIERLMALWERGQSKQAEAAFNAAMAAAQQKMRPVATDAINPQTRSRYASYAAIDRDIRSIYTAEGFGLSFDTADAPIAEHVRLVCYVTHLAGFSRTYHVDMPADGKGAKGGDVMTKTHAAGAAMSYGMRYLLKLIFNVAVGEDDDDGNSAEPKKAAVTIPQGYDDWLADIESAAEEGAQVLAEAWRKSPAACRACLVATAAPKWEQLKRKAALVKAQS